MKKCFICRFTQKKKIYWEKMKALKGRYTLTMGEALRNLRKKLNNYATITRQKLCPSYMEHKIP